MQWILNGCCEEVMFNLAGINVWYCKQTSQGSLISRVCLLLRIDILICDYFYTRVVT
jgi:hypothetical protein